MQYTFTDHHCRSFTVPEEDMELLDRLGNVSVFWCERYQVYVTIPEGCCGYCRAISELMTLYSQHGKAMPDRILVGKRPEPLPGTTLDPHRPAPHFNPNDPRDRYCYEQRGAGIPLKEIKQHVNSDKGWEPLESDQGVSAAARRYAERHGLPWPI